MKSRAFVSLLVVLPIDVLFGDEPDEIHYFRQGWGTRVLGGPNKMPPEGRQHVPDADQTCRVSWERGWLGADAVIRLLVEGGSG